MVTNAHKHLPYLLKNGLDKTNHRAYLISIFVGSRSEYRNEFFTFLPKIQVPNQKGSPQQWHFNISALSFRHSDPARFFQFQFRKKLESSVGSSVRSQRLEDDEAHFIDGHVTLMTVQQASGESHGSEDDMVKRKILHAQASHDLELLFNPPPTAQQ